MKVYSNSPYYDDFSEDKQFYRILYKPGVAVQARELTQMQTILQNQIRRFGQNIFKEGAIVLPGQTTFDNNYKYVKLAVTYNSVSADDVINNLVGDVIVGQTSGVRASVVNYTVATETDPPTIFVKYLDSGTSRTATGFTDDEVLVNEDSSISVRVATSSATGKGTAFIVTPGVIFCKGHFVYFAAETIIVSKYTNIPSKSIGFNVTDTVVISDDNASLLDPAIDTYNYFAPGADRYSIELSLTTRELSSNVDDDTYIELARVEDGVLLTLKKPTDYNILNDVLARRTFDESGNYTVRPYGLELAEHLRTSNVSVRDGMLTSNSGGNSNLFVNIINPGKSYVMGYELENVKTQYIVAEKARDYKTINNGTVSTETGYFVYITGQYSTPDLLTLSPVSLYNRFTTANASSSGTLVGTARIRALEPYSGTGSSGVYKAFLFDVRMTEGYTFEDNVKQLYYNNTGFADFTANVVPVSTTLTGTVTTTNASNNIVGSGTAFTSELKSGDYITINSNIHLISAVVNNILAYAGTSITGNISGVSANKLQANIGLASKSAYIYELPYSTIKEVDPTNLETIYSSRRIYDRTLAGGNVSITAGTDEVFASYSSDNYAVINKTTGEHIDLSGKVTRSGSPTGKTITFTLGAGYGTDDVRIISTINKSNTSADKKIKTLVSSAVIDFTSNVTATASTLSLGQADVFRLSNVRMSANAFGTAYLASNSIDITDRYELDNGQRRTHYDLGTLTLKKSSPKPTGPIRVVFDYFTHSSGDYFSVNSYNDIDYKDIPSYVDGNKTYYLRDCLDFRPRIDTSGNTFTSPSEFPDIENDITTDYSYYIGRADKLIIDSTGAIKVIQGISSENPSEPSTPPNSMALYVLKQKPYVFDLKTDIDVTQIDNKRFTMRDIGRIENRVKNLEYYTTLSLLEKDTSLFQIKDNFGLDRFKNGFVVDNFTGHRIGNTQDPDYNISMDFDEGVLRPTFTQTNLKLKEISTTDNQRSSNGYVRTGAIVSLNYTSNLWIESNVASRTENVNPFEVINYTGSLTLDPPSDVWFETQRAPDVYIDREGNYSTLTNSRYDTVWGSWQTVWYGNQRLEERTGTSYRVIESIDTSVNNDVVVSKVVVPKMRSIAIKFTASGLKPNTKLEAYFDNYRVTDMCLANSESNVSLVFTSFVQNDANIITDYKGDVEGTFYYNESKLQLPTGEKIFRLTDSPINGSDNETAAEARFNSNGELRTIRNEIISTRNGYVANETVVDRRNVYEPVYVDYYDPGIDWGGNNTNNVGNGGVAPGNNDVVITQINNQVIIDDSGTTTVVTHNPPPRSFADLVAGYTAGHTAVIRENSVDVLQANASSLRQAASGVGAGEISIINTFVSSTGAVSAPAIREAINSGAYTPSAATVEAFSYVHNIVSTSINDAVALGTLNSTADSSAYSAWLGVGASHEEAIWNIAAQATTAYLADPEVVASNSYWGPAVNAARSDASSDNNVNIADTALGQLEPGKCWGVDPLAQTFVVVGNPIILTSVDLFFSAKDNILPMYVEIRKVVNGFPTQTVIPFSRKTVTPSEITTSVDGSVATNIAFEGLVYLEPGEYALTLLASYTGYRVWISQIGENDVITGKLITEQPFIGVLFKSQNASTWVADQFQDLKFRLYQAKFTPNTPATIDFEVSRTLLEKTLLTTDPLESYPSSPVIRVLHENHGFIDGSYQVLTGIPPINFDPSEYGNIFGINTALISNVAYSVSNVTPDSYTIILPTSSNVTSITRGGDTSIFAETDLQYDAIYPAISYLNFAGTLINFSAKLTDATYSVNGSFTELGKDITTEFDTTKVIPSSTNITNNLSGAQPFRFRITLNTDNENISPILDLEQNSIVLIKNRINNPSYSSENTSLDITTLATNNNISFTKLTTNTGLISFVTVANRANVSGVVVGTTVTVTGSSNNNSTYRVLDVIDSGANIKVFGTVVTEAANASGNVTVTNGIKFVAEEAASGGSALAKYITKKIDFTSPSTSINLRMDTAKPNNANIKVYYKTKLVGESADLASKEYTEITGITIPDSLSGEFIEVEKQLDNLPQYESLVIKIVLLSSNSAAVPKVKNLRVIALQ